MFKYFDFLTDVIDLLWDFFSTSITFVINIFTQISHGFIFIFQIVQTLPPFCVGFIYFLFGFSLSTLLLGHLLDY